MRLISEIVATESIEDRKAHAQQYIAAVNSKFSELRYRAALAEDWNRWRTVQEIQSVLDGALESNPGISDLELHRAIVLSIHLVRRPRPAAFKLLGLRVPRQARKNRDSYELILAACDSALPQDVHDYLRENAAFYLERSV